MNWISVANAHRSIERLTLIRPVCFLAVLSIFVACHPANAADLVWPGSHLELKNALAKATEVLHGRALEEARSTRRKNTSHVTTSTRDGAMQGGGYHFIVRHEQAFEIQGALVGKTKPGKLSISYESGGSDAFPGRQSPFVFANNAGVILFLSGEQHLIKALPDSPENRKLISTIVDNP